MKICFTGPSRLGELEYQFNLMELLQDMEDNIDHAYVGGATGFDEAARRALVELRISHTVCLPHPEYRKYWAEKGRAKEFDRIAKQPNTIWVCNPLDQWRPGMNIARNHYMVDRSRLLIAVCPYPKGRSGEAATVRYAVKRRIPVRYMP